MVLGTAFRYAANDTVFNFSLIDTAKLCQLGLHNCGTSFSAVPEREHPQFFMHLHICSAAEFRGEVSCFPSPCLSALGWRRKTFQHSGCEQSSPCTLRWTMLSRHCTANSVGLCNWQSILYCPKARALSFLYASATLQCCCQVTAQAICRHISAVGLCIFPSPGLSALDWRRKT